ncbi:14581_t:CDS:2 [Acaulospora colombiana]|uniref:14581_t:CDS:1 n=1 Tax=Acaulospora colombiana TaxID=27376 RepID=A0ACA9L526_9GLOM|nr:14581_t:CDS:2 [Acaulospora colombiana]
MFKATWIRNSGEDVKVVLKSFHYSGNITTDLLLEDNSNIHMIVMEYAENGSLHQYLLSNFEKITWNEKIEKLHHIATGFEKIHENNLIHCDVHSGNIVLGVGGVSGSIRIADLGLCKSTNLNTPENIFGVIPYMAPEILERRPFTQASDVYSFGILMWEFTSGHKPFKNRAHDHLLILDIINGLRPEITGDTPSVFANLIKRCWSNNPADRPTMSDIGHQFDKWTRKENEKDFIIAEGRRKNIIIEKQRSQQSKDDLTHPGAHYRSRALDVVISGGSRGIHQSFR